MGSTCGTRRLVPGRTEPIASPTPTTGPRIHTNAASGRKPRRAALRGQSRPYRKSTICVAGGNDPVTPEPTQPASVIMVMPLT